MKLLMGQAGSLIIQKIDPRTKMFWLIGNLLISFTFHGIGTLSLLVAMILFTSILARIRLIDFWPILKIMTVIGIQFVILQGFLRPQGAVIFRLGSFKLYLGGVLIGTQGILLLLTLTLLCLQFFLWTTPEDLTLLMVKLRIPHKYAVLLGLTLRFIPVVEKDLSTILESQQTRGLQLKTIRQKAKGLISISLPLILRTLKRAQDVALSMELKGYTLYSRRTLLRTLKWTKMDYCCLIMGLLYFGVVMVWNVYL
jgi:energy-coupling factor transport system permease protein